MAFGRTWGEDLAGMVIAAGDVTFAQAEEWERRVAAADPDPATASARWVGNAAAVYRQFAEVGGRLVANSMNGSGTSPTATSTCCRTCRGRSPTCGRSVGSPLSRSCASTSPWPKKVIVPHSDALRSDPALADFQGNLDPAYFDGSAYYTAYVISPKDTQPPEQPPRCSPSS